MFPWSTYVVLTPSDPEGALLQYLKLSSYGKKCDLVKAHPNVFLSNAMLTTIEQFILNWQFGSEPQRVWQLRQDQMVFRLCQHMPLEAAFASLDQFFKSPAVR